jgi:hypothetical protein
MSVQQTETRDLRDAVMKTSSQLNELKPLQDAVKQISTQFSSLSLLVRNQASQSSQPSSLKYRTNQPADSEFISEFDDSDFPILPPPNHPPTSQQLHNAKSTPTRQQTHEQLKEDVMSAMYVDLREKQRRSRNFVISGLKPSAESDKTVVCKLLRAEYRCWRTSELEEAIVSCKRLGKLQRDRVQPLLVTMDSTESAAHFITNAKQLRRSHDTIVSENIFISEDLTKAEAKAAYETRCRRREQHTITNQEPRSGHDLQKPPQQQQAGRGHPGSTTRLIYRSTRTAANAEEQSSRQPASDADDSNNSDNSNNNADSSILTDQPLPSATATMSQGINSTNSAATAGQMSRPAAAGSSPTAGRHRQ